MYACQNHANWILKQLSGTGTFILGDKVFIKLCKKGIINLNTYTIHKRIIEGHISYFKNS